MYVYLSVCLSDSVCLPACQTSTARFDAMVPFLAVMHMVLAASVEPVLRGEGGTCIHLISVVRFGSMQWSTGFFGTAAARFD